MTNHRRLLLATDSRARRRQRLARKLLCLLRAMELLRARHFLRSRALVRDQVDVPWYFFYRARDYDSFVALVSIPPAALDELLAAFDAHYIVLTGPGRRGRPPRIVAKHCVLGLVLAYYTNATEHKTLCKMFAVAPSTLSVILDKAEVALEQALLHLYDARVTFPSISRQRQWASATHDREPLVTGVFGFVDGKNLRVQSPSHIDLQHAMYNGNNIEVIFGVRVGN